MKKIKKAIAALTAFATVLCSGITGINAYASTGTGFLDSNGEWVDCWHNEFYKIDSLEYEKITSGIFYIPPLSEDEKGKILEMTEVVRKMLWPDVTFERFPDIDPYQKLYAVERMYKGDVVINYVAEVGDDTERSWLTLEVFWSNLTTLNHAPAPSIEEINAFLQDGGYKAHVEMRDYETNLVRAGMVLVFDEDVMHSEVIDTSYALAKGLGLYPARCGGDFGTIYSSIYSTISQDTDTTEESKAETEVLNDFSILSYDITGDGVFGMSDVVSLQKALSTRKATLDMDINGDGKVNVFDLVAAKKLLTESLGTAKSL